MTRLARPGRAEAAGAGPPVGPRGTGDRRARAGRPVPYARAR